VDVIVKQLSFHSARGCGRHHLPRRLNGVTGERECESAA
jgi:hypothetical protein